MGTWRPRSTPFLCALSAACVLPSFGCRRPSVSGTAANLSVSSSLTFSTVSLNSTTTATFNVSNGGQTAAKNVSMTGWTSPFSYSGGSYPGSGGNCATTIEGGTACSIVLSYAPTSGVSHNLSVAFSYLDGNTSQSTSVALSGTAVPQGILDTSFSSDGIAEFEFGAYDENIKDVIVRSDGKIILLGDADDGASSDRNGTVVRVNPDGTADSAFGTSGKISFDGGSNANEDIQAGRLLSNDAVLIAGSSGSQMFLARMTSSGSFDSTFGILGKAILSLAQVLHTEAAYDVITDSADRIIVVGESDPVGAPPISNSQMLIRRFDSTGTIPDPLFGLLGVKLLDFTANQDDRALAVTIQSDGMIVVAGYTDGGGTTRNSAIARLDPTLGSLDTSFNTTGQRALDLCGLGKNDQIEDVAVNSLGKIIVVGSCDTVGTGKDMVIAQFNADGSTDTAFGTSGVVRKDIAGGNDEAYRVKIQSDGKILVAGYGTSGGRERFILLNLNADGSMNNSFGSSGVATDTVGTTHARAQAMAIQQDGKIVLAGYSTNATRDYAVTRHYP